MLQKLPIALQQVKARNNSENVLNEIRLIANSLYQLKEITKKGFNIENNTIFTNSKNNKTSKPHVLIFNLTNKIYLRRDEENIASSNLSIYYPWENIKNLIAIINSNKFCSNME